VELKKLSRRQFIKVFLGGIAALYAGRKITSCVFSEKSEPAAAFSAVPKKKIILSAVKGKDHRNVVREAVRALGGMSEFVKKGSIVVVKPNMSWDRTPGQAANTNPVIVEEVVRMCIEAGASKVKVFDRCCSNAARAYKNSGVADAARKAGADVFHLDDWNFVKASFSYESPMHDWPVYRDAITADCFINLPVLKHHSLTGLTLSMKNLMGVLGGDRGRIHWNISKKLAHITDFISPDLNIMDATRVLARNGPSGGSPEDVKIYDTVIAGTDPVLVDSESARLVGYAPLDIGYIRVASQMGLGSVTANPENIYRKQI